MKWNDWLEQWGMTSLKISVPFLDMEWRPKDEDKNAAWEMYIELLTRITTQPISEDQGDEETALKSIYALFGITRTIITEHGRDCLEFTKIAVVVLNQIIRPFTSKWHTHSVAGAFQNTEQAQAFRIELRRVQEQLRIYTKMLAQMAGVEDLTDLEES